jgi:hypothetical protein
VRGARTRLLNGVRVLNEAHASKLCSQQVLHANNIFTEPTGCARSTTLGVPQGC